MNRSSKIIRYRDALPVLLPLIVLLLWFAAPVFAESPTTEPQLEALPIHEQVLAHLKKQDSVLTRVLPDLHPKRTTYNAEAPIPPQCYTRTEGQYNPCYVCHQNQISQRENDLNDGSLQLAYAFSDVGVTNHWRNLFEDRSAAVANISDQQIRQWTSTDNYKALAPRLRTAGFNGWIPDLANLALGAGAFDAEGFALDGSHWVAFSYKPLPSTFWPTNGSTDDVMIRLGPAFRQTRAGVYSRDVYKANLAILEARIKGYEKISSLPVDERVVQVDLNQDGRLDVVEEISAVERYVGGAQDRFSNTYLYPRDTEFLHTVRYVGIDSQGLVGASERIKEVRYMRKWEDYSKATYQREYELENFGKEAGRLPRYALLGDQGLDNGYGWSVQGFIEDRKGELRTLTYEENLFCMGCHSSIGSTIDKTFAFPRKVDGAPGWKYIDLHDMPDAPNVGEEAGEIATYLARVGGGGEFRSNEEMFSKWFHPNGQLNRSAVAAARDVYELISPSPQRALELNKAYRVIVQEQDYLYGRDATVRPPKNVYQAVDVTAAPTLGDDKFFAWDIRLAWPETFAAEINFVKSTKPLPTP